MKLRYDLDTAGARHEYGRYTDVTQKVKYQIRYIVYLKVSVHHRSKQLALCGTTQEGKTY